MDKELNLDLSGGPKSWFDLWHTHADWDGKGNNDWGARKNALNQLFETFNSLKLRLRKYPHAFQLWIMIDEGDSGNDSVYVHTKNPNAENFPVKIEIDRKITIKDKDLKQFVDSLDFEKIRVQTSDGDIYYLFGKHIGISLV
jgi:hypothetical protein